MRNHVLFEEWERTGSIKKACEKARLSRYTFYYWKPRFDKDGNAGLEEPHSHAPLKPRKTELWLAKQVIEMKRTHPEWGYQRIADELMKRNNWERVISYGTVRRILKSQGLTSSETSKGKKKEQVVRHAEQVGQTVNADFCFVPLTHKTSENLPAVSGSSTEHTWPGQVFNNPEVTYEQTMDSYVASRTTNNNANGQDNNNQTQREPEENNSQANNQARKKELQRQEEMLREQRRKVREQRKYENLAWRQLKKQHREAKASYRQLPKTERRAKRKQQKAKEQIWVETRTSRRQQMQRRKEETQAWRAQRKQILEQLTPLVTTVWIAILVIVDNCTRQCLGVPMFVAGPNVTAQMVYDAFFTLLPSNLQYLVTDRDRRFWANIIQSLAHLREFTHVPLTPHRPQCNGIAERFVQTLKTHLSPYSWQSPEQLQSLLLDFLQYYNDRPHQGEELKGLSPNEYAKKIAS